MLKAQNRSLNSNYFLPSRTAAAYAFGMVSSDSSVLKLVLRRVQMKYLIPTSAGTPFSGETIGSYIDELF